MEILKNPRKLPAIFDSLAQGAQGVLLCDYDGTLAPFCEDPRKAVPYSWVPALLGDIQREGTRVIVVTGRLAEDLTVLLPLSGVEIWGSHGRERLFPDGRRWVWEPDPHAEQLLDTIRTELSREWPHVRMERKVGCLAIHFRGLPDQEVERLQRSIADFLHRQDPSGLLERKAFHLGVELQIPGPTKGDAVRGILQELGDRRTVVAFLGDDRTDEDAFRALGEAGLSVLVSPTPRETYADVRLENEGEVHDFLHRWLNAARKGGDHDRQ